MEWPTCDERLGQPCPRDPWRCHGRHGPHCIFTQSWIRRCIWIWARRREVHSWGLASRLMGQWSEPYFLSLSPSFFLPQSIPQPLNFFSQKSMGGGVFLFCFYLPGIFFFFNNSFSFFFNYEKRAQNDTILVKINENS